MLLAGFSGGSSLNMGEEYLLASIAVTVIGGTSVAGGRAEPLGIWGAALLLFLIVTMLNTFGLSAGVRLIATGVIIVTVIAIGGGRQDAVVSEHFQRARSLGRREGLVQRRQILRRQVRSAAARLALTWSGSLALGIATTPSCASTQASATWNGVAFSRSAMDWRAPLAGMRPCSIGL